METAAVSASAAIAIATGIVITAAGWAEVQVATAAVTEMMTVAVEIVAAEENARIMTTVAAGRILTRSPGLSRGLSSLTRVQTAAVKNPQITAVTATGNKKCAGITRTFFLRSPFSHPAMWKELFTVRTVIFEI